MTILINEPFGWISSIAWWEMGLVSKAEHLQPRAINTASMRKQAIHDLIATHAKILTLYLYLIYLWCHGAVCITGSFQLEIKILSLLLRWPLFSHKRFLKNHYLVRATEWQVYLKKHYQITSHNSIFKSSEAIADHFHFLWTLHLHTV